ncbi:hypothetical protein BD408DRAFT_168918 [Parasitella parasitica]|nr:hypothetical protein BD408DRAFT_168918 [Parasitella parasitica]
MLSGSATTSKSVAVVSGPPSITAASQKFNNKFSFDTFDSPFHTPSLFVTNAPMKNNDIFNTFYSNADAFNHQNYQHQHQYANQFSPEFYGIMADVESSGTRTPSPRNESLASAARDDLFKMEPPFLYHPQHQRKVTPLRPLFYEIILIHTS